MKRLTITGYIGRDPEMRMDPSGQQFTTFSVGINVGTKLKSKTDWVEVSCNGKLAEVMATYGKKGIKVFVDGFPRVNAYINKENLPVGTLRVYAHSIELLTRSSEESNEIDTITAELSAESMHLEHAEAS